MKRQRKRRKIIYTRRSVKTFRKTTIEQKKNNICVTYLRDY